MNDYLKVLLVHPNEELIHEVKLFLGHTVIHYASDGADGLFAGRMEEYDLVVCAIDLPLITGLEMVRALRNMSQNSKTPVIFLGEGTESEACLRLISRLRGGYFLREELASLDFSCAWQNAKASLEII
jgi:two-component system chemotaxis response regulator CheY